MKLRVEIEIREGPDPALKDEYEEEEWKEMVERGRGSEVISVKCDGEVIEPEQDSIGRSCGDFYRLPGPEKDDCFTIEVVKWES